ncbi:MAG TPA: AAA family ATPase [Caldimonas sp.]
MPPAAVWCLHLIGMPCLVRRQPHSSVRLSPKDAALLALVALDGPLPPEVAAAMLWPAGDRRKADTNLRQRLFRLRRNIGANVVEGGALLRLAAGIETDLVATLARVAADEHAAREEFLGALQFEDLPELAAWMRAARNRWHEQRDAALARAAAACEASGAVARGLVYAQRLVESDPLSEHAHRRLMRLHYMRADSSAAVAAFESFEQRLKDELGVRPSAETIELLKTIERSAAALPARRAVVPASLLRPPRLVGRSAELARLARAWDEGRVFALLGEAGIGKSRLLQEVCTDDGGIVLARARPGDAGIAYALLARLIRVVLERHPLEGDDARRRQLALAMPELGEPAVLTGDAQRLGLQRATEATLADAAGSGLTGVIVDDLQLADAASIELLQSMTQSDRLANLHWGYAQRPADAAAAAADLRATLEDAQRLETISLGPLDLAQLHELVESLALPEADPARLSAALLKHTGGNPMFALETLKDMVLSGSSGDDRLPQPGTVATLVARRLLQLSPAALKLARAAALAGANFSAELAAAVLELHPLDLAEPWRELEAAQVIRDGAFAHDLIFEATQASVPAQIAQLLHGRIAAQLQSRGAKAASIAPHWAGARDWARAGEAHVEAARQARAASQRSHEVEHWRRARDCFDQVGDQSRSFDARCESVQAVIVMEGVANANALIDSLVDEARSDAQRVTALTTRALAALMAVDHRTGIPAAVQAAELARRLPSPGPRWEAERLHAVGLAQSGRSTEALAIIEALKEEVERDGSDEQRGRLWSDYAYVLNSVRHLRDAGVALAHAIAHAQTQGDLAELATLTSNLATVKGNLGHVGEALELAQRSLALQVQLGTTEGPGGGVVETYVGLYCGMAGRYREALAMLDSALTRFRRDRQTLWIAVAANHRAQFLIELGQFARARQALAFDAPPVESVRARGENIAARIERALGKSGRVELQRALAILAQGGDPHVRMHTLLDEAAVLDPAAAVARCVEVARMATELEFVGVSMKADLLRARALHRANAVDAGVALLREVLPRLATAQPADMYLPDAWWIAAQVFEAGGAADDAASALAEGQRWIRQTALAHVPDEFRDSFLDRNPTNVAILAAARRSDA